MFITISFSGGVKHEADVAKEKQDEVATKVAATITSLLEDNAASGTGSVTVGESTVSFTATSSKSL